MASQSCLRPLLAGLLAAAVLAPAWGMAPPLHDVTAARPWRYGASVEGHVPALPQAIRDAVSGGGSIGIEVGLFRFATLAFEASFDPKDSWWGMSADIASPGAAGVGRPPREEREEHELQDDLPDLLGMYFGSRGARAPWPARLKAIAAKVSRDLGFRTPKSGAFSSTLH